jgi:hypothetical protein
VRKLERRKGPRDTDHFKTLVARLDRLIADARQLRAQIEALRTRDPLYHFRQLVRRQTRPFLPFSSEHEFGRDN